MKGLNGLDWVALVLTIVGGLNWGLWGFFGFNLVSELFGSMSGIETVIYDLVGLSALYLAFIAKGLSRK